MRCGEAPNDVKDDSPAVLWGEGHARQKDDECKAPAVGLSEAHAQNIWPSGLL